MLVRSLQHRGGCCARLALDNEEYRTAGFRESRWKKTSKVFVDGAPGGWLEICATGRKPASAEGLFCEEEQTLLNAATRLAGQIAEGARARAALRETNLALGRVVDRIEEEKDAVRKSISENVDKILMPTLRTLERQVPASQKSYVAQLRRDLETIASPFVNRVSTAFATLTGVEIKICKMIEQGLSTDEIARLRHVSPATVTKQRERIRRKLRLQGTGTNLASFLLAFGAEDSGTPAV